MITYNAPDRLKQTAFTVPNGVDKFVIVNDGTSYLYTSDCYPKEAEVINHSKNLGVGCAKNTALRALIQSGCDYLFLIEDDIMIKDPNVFEQYIKAGEKSGLWHMCFALHGPANISQDGKPIPQQIVDYGDGIEIGFYKHSVGAFCMYLKNMIRHVGYMDERYKNAFEHVDHSFRIVKAGFIPAYWYWPDIMNSQNYLQETASSTVSTVIPHTPEWQKNFQIAAMLFKHLHGHYPTQIPDTSPEVILENLNKIQQNYGKR